jgi:hypothetical protein
MGKRYYILFIQYILLFLFGGAEKDQICVLKLVVGLAKGNSLLQFGHHVAKKFNKIFPQLFEETSLPSSFSVKSGIHVP